jgi:hypothetical protein
LLALLVIVVVGLALALCRRGRRGDVLAVVGALLAPSARVWLEAMRAEYAAIEDPRERRRFARGCVTALFAGPVPSDATGLAMRSAVAVAIAAAVALAAFGLLRYPGLRSGAWLVYVAVFAAALCLYALLGSRFALVGPARARRVGLLIAVPAAGLAAVAAAASGPLSPMPALVLPALPAVAGFLAARRHGSAVSGVAAAATCAILAVLLAFVGFVSVTYAIDGGSPTPALLAEFHRSGTHDYATWAVGDNLGGAVSMLGLVLVVGIILGVAAASLAAPQQRTAPA